MASNVTHYFFGERFLNYLPENVRELILLNKEHYIIGQQGPDPFFFHIFSKEDKDPGSLVHEKSLHNFYLKNKDLLDNSPLYSPVWAYFIGFICHFSLDISIHRSITELEKQLHIDHMLMERELDRLILKEEDQDPKKFLSRNLIPHPKYISETMYSFYKSYPGVSFQSVKESLYLFRIIEMLFHVSSPRQERKKKKLLRSLGLNPSFQGKLLGQTPHPESRISNVILRNDLEDAFYIARDICYYYLINEPDRLQPAEIFLNFNGDKTYE